MAHTYDIGDVVRCTATFTDADGLEVDPTTVKFSYRDPAGNKATYEYGIGSEVVRTGPGAYYVDLPVDVAHTWRIRWEGTGANKAAGESFFIIRSSLFI